MTGSEKPLSKTLSELAAEAMLIEQYLIDSGGELNEQVEAWLAEVESKITEKVDSYKWCMDRFQSSARMLKEKADQFYNAAKMLENTSDRLKERIKLVMQQTNRSEIHGDHYVFKLSDSAPKIILSESKLPPKYRYQVTTWEIDKEKVKEDFKAGVEIPGVESQPVKALRVSINRGAK
jgi:hypothetical protein